jgi:hypothetical protein
VFAHDSSGASVRVGGRARVPEQARNSGKKTLEDTP